MPRREVYDILYRGNLVKKKKNKTKKKKKLIEKKAILKKRKPTEEGNGKTAQKRVEVKGAKLRRLSAKRIAAGENASVRKKGGQPNGQKISNSLVGGEPRKP